MRPAESHLVEGDEPVDRDWAALWRRAGARQAPHHVGGPFAVYDAMGRKQPERLGLGHYLLLVARIEPARVRRVPSQAIQDETVDDGRSIALVQCPCGAHPVVGEEIQRCTDCQRWYVYIDGQHVFVVYGEMDPPPLPIASP